MSIMMEQTAVRSTPARQTERRREMRQRVLKGGFLSFNRGFGALECKVRNLSQSGAHLVFGDTAGVPAKFRFRLADSKEMREATVRWRTMTDIGISFE